MEIGGKQTISKSTGKKTRSKGTVYRIVVQSELNGRYALAFEEMEMETKNGDTILTGEIVDQPHLHGILNRINGLGLRLLSVQALPDHVHPGPESKQEEPDL